jgi:uncharacterized protein (DUF433 family)
VTARAIVRDSKILDGRWHFEGTTITVAEVRQRFGAGEATQIRHTAETYERAGLSAEDLAAAQAFEFPKLRDVTVDVVMASMVVNCVCGEHTAAAVVGPGTSVVTCPCNRTWRITVEADPA